MMQYDGPLYGRHGRRHFPTGKTGADWDALQARAELAENTVRKILSGSATIEEMVRLAESMNCQYQATFKKDLPHSHQSEN